jgi:hypothetical protein
MIASIFFIDPATPPVGVVPRGVGPVRPVAAREAGRWNYVRRRPVPPTAPGLDAPGEVFISTGHAKAGPVQAAGLSAFAVH